VRLLRDSFPERPALDIAVSHALLMRVARGELEPTVRLYRPAPTLAFGRLDALRPGFAEAGAAARDAGFAPIVRLAGGHAAAYHEQSLIYEEIVAQHDVTAGLHDRFRDAAQLLAGVLAGLGVEAHVGEIPGEYCPGEYSINARGRTKLVGIGQRIIKGGSHIGGVIVVGDSARIRDVLIPVYGALGLVWDPDTSGSIEDEIGPVPFEDVAAAIRAELPPLTEATLDDATLALAEALEPQHLG
jgi:octanoyl-[GcvH]:protein N-octanoyltransferase